MTGKKNNRALAVRIMCIVMAFLMIFSMIAAMIALL